MILYNKDHAETIENPIITNLTTGSEFIINNRNFKIFSIYIRPTSEHHEVQTALDNIKKESEGIGKSRVIIGGDVNATDPLWAPMSKIDRLLDPNRQKHSSGNNNNIYKKNARGRIISNFLKDMKLTCINNKFAGPTFVSNIKITQPINDANDNGYRYPTSHIDIIAVGGKAARIWKTFKLIKIGGSQHRLLITEPSKSSNNNSSYNKRRTIYQVNKLNVEYIRDIEISTLNDVRFNFWDTPMDSLKKRIETFTDKIIRHTLDIQDSIKKVSKRTNGKTRNYNNQGNQIRKRTLISKLIKLENKRENLQKQDYYRNKHHNIPRIANVNERIRRYRNKLLCEVDKDINSMGKHSSKDSDMSLWVRIQYIGNIERDMNQSNSTSSNNSINSQFEIEQVADSKFNKIGMTEIEDELTPSPDDEVIIFQHETDNATHDIRKKKFTGPEGIKFQVFNKLLQIEEYRRIIDSWIRMCFKGAYIPNRCRLTIGKLIPKKARGQFRIVHICSPLSAILKQVALRRLEYRLEQNILYNPRQFGFTPSRGRHDLIARVIELAVKHQLRKQFNDSTTIVSLDVKGAFDNVDQSMLKDKIMKELDPDPFRFWLANFIQNRSIQIQYGNFTSAKRLITKGVPQGSSLGPILWNLVINRIDERLTAEPEKFEILAYADDLYIVYNGRDNNHLQDKLNELVNNLTNLRLEVEPNKCQLMVIDFSSTSSRWHPKIKMYEEGVKEVQNMSILGVPTINKLKLDTEDEKFKDGLVDKMQLLNSIKRFDIINLNKEWRILLDSYILSVLVTNNIPILAIDSKAIEWVNRKIERAMRFIFDWPQNSSLKVIRTITDSFDARLTIRSAINKATIKQEFKDTYDLINRTLEYGGLDEIRRSTIRERLPNNIRAIDYTIMNGHTFRDPQRNWRLRMQADLQQIYRRGPVWFAVSSRNTASLFLIMNNLIIQELRGQHNQYKIGHFNLMGLLYEVGKMEELPSKTIIFSKENSLYNALNNPSNHNWRINMLQEWLLDYNWTITTINTEQYNSMMELLKERGRIHRRSGDINEYERHQIRTDGVRLIQANWPPVSDYLELYREKARLNMERQQDRHSNSTRLMRKISQSTHSWLTLSPSWISGRTMLMLSGLVNDHEDKLTQGQVCPGNKPIGCGEDCLYSIRSTTDDKWDSETTLHRAFIYPKYRKERSILRRTINRGYNLNTDEQSEYSIKPWNKYEAMERTMSDKMLSQTLLRILTKLAFTNRTTGSI